MESNIEMGKFDVSHSFDKISKNSNNNGTKTFWIVPRCSENDRHQLRMNYSSNFSPFRNERIFHVSKNPQMKPSLDQPKTVFFRICKSNHIMSSNLGQESEIIFRKRTVHLRILFRDKWIQEKYPWRPQFNNSKSK